MANPSWFNEVEYLNGKLVQLNANGFKDANGNAFTSISQVADAITAGGMDAFEHYNAYGSEEGISPSNAFNAVEYCTFKLNSLRTTGSDAQKAEWAGKGWQDVQYAIHKGGMSLGEHYSEYGFVEGVPMSNAFDGNKYLEAKLLMLQNNEATSAQWGDQDVPALAAFFKANGTDPYTHYLTYGGAEGEVPAGMDFKPEQVAPGGGVAVALTTEIDTITAGAKDTTFVASYSKDGNTFNAGDHLTGGAGNDTLILDRQGDVIAGLQTVSGIENVVVYDNASTPATAYNMTQFAGMKSFSYTGPDAMTAQFADTVTDVALNGAASGSAVTGKGIASLSLANMAVDTTVTVNNSTANHALKLTLDKVGTNSTALSLKDATLGQLDIMSNGEMNSLKFAAATTKLATVTIEGKGDLYLDMTGATAKNVKSIDGSKAEGDLNISGIAAGTDTILTGAGDDHITIAKTADLGGSEKIDMGAGDADTLLISGDVYNFADKDAGYMKAIMASKGIEILATDAAVAAAPSGTTGATKMTVDMTYFAATGIDTFLISGAGATGSGYIGGSGAHSTVAASPGADGGNGMLFTSDDSTLVVTNSTATALAFTGGLAGSGNTTGAGGNGGHGLQVVDGGNTGDVTLSFDGDVTFTGGSGNSGGNSGNGGNGGHGLEADGIDVLNLVFTDAANTVTFLGGSGGGSGAVSYADGNDGAGVSIAAKGTINISGTAKEVDLGLVQAGGNNIAGGAANTTINAEGFNGDLIVTTGVGNDTLIGGNGADKLTGGAGVNTFTGNGGADTFIIGGPTSAAAMTEISDYITDFNRTEGDKIDVAGVVIGTVAQFQKAASAAASMTDLLAAANKALDGTVDYYVGWIGQNTYLFADEDGTGITAIVELTGIANGDLNYTDLV